MEILVLGRLLSGLCRRDGFYLESYLRFFKVNVGRFMNFRRRVVSVRESYSSTGRGVGYFWVGDFV